jgi:hypothetical protein
MIAGAESKLGYKLPDSYIRLLRIKNGGSPKRQCLPTAGTNWSDNHLRISAICGIGGRWGIDSAELGSQRMIEQGFPAIGVFIGWTPTAGHDGVMLDYTHSGDEPCVVLADLESDELQELAPTFEMFIDRLVDCKPYDAETARAMEAFRRRTGGA